MPMNKTKLAIVGLNFGHWIVEDFLRPGQASDNFELAAVCDMDKKRADDMGARSGAQVYYNLDELLARDDIPAIGLYTGPIGRAELIRKIIRAGKHIMTTKPFELDPDKALAVLKEAKALGRVVYMNSPGPTLPPDLQQIQKLREKHELGKPISARADVWVSYREKADGGWYDDPEKCPLAPIFRLGIYLINDLARIFGEAEKVQALKSRIFTERPTVDNAQLGIAYKNGAVANIYASFCVNDGQHYSNGTTLNFENGTIYRNVGPLAFGEGKRKLVVVSRHGEGEPVTETVDFDERSGDYQWETFRRAMQGEVIEGEITPEEVVAGLRVVAAMARAQKSEKTEIV